MTAPPVAATVFGDRLALAERYARWLTGAGIDRGLLGPHEADQVWTRHILNGVGIAALIEPESVVVDIGSGAGLPGVPLSLARPDLTVVLVEPKARRVAFLEEVCADLGLAVQVVRARATRSGLVRLPDGTPPAAIPAADVVIGRAVAALADLAGWARPMLRAGGQLLAVKGVSANTEVHRDRGALDALGYTGIRTLTTEATSGAAVHRPTASADSDAAPTTTVVAMTLARVSRET